jgi:pimeloyl-ACP methyl ester carboxylesterase
VSGSPPSIFNVTGNGYDAGFVESFWKTVWDYQTERTVDTEAAVRQFLTLKATRWQYLSGVADETLVDPESWYHDHALISRPGNDEVQLKLLRDYATNSPLYPHLHEYFRASRVPMLAVWGRGDEIFGPAGAQAFAEDLPDAEIHLLDGGHFLLESALDEVIPLIRAFLGKQLRVD